MKSKSRSGIRIFQAEVAFLAVLFGVWGQIYFNREMFSPGVHCWGVAFALAMALGFLSDPGEEVVFPAAEPGPFLNFMILVGTYVIAFFIQAILIYKDQGRFVSVFCVVQVLSLYVWARISDSNFSPGFPEQRTAFAKWEVYALAGLILLSCLLIFYRYSELPVTAYMDDESTTADSLDPIGKSNQGSPFYEGTYNGLPILMMYSKAFFDKFFHDDPLLARKFDNSLQGVILPICVFFLVRCAFGPVLGIGAGVFTAGCSSLIVFERIGSIFLPNALFAVLLAGLLIQGLKTGKNHYLMLAGLSMGFGLHGYFTMHLAPLYLALFWAVMIFFDKAHWSFRIRQGVWFWLSFLAMGLPYLIWTALHFHFMAQGTIRVETFGLSAQSVWAHKIALYQDIVAKYFTFFNYNHNNPLLYPFMASFTKPPLETIVAVLWVLGLAYTIARLRSKVYLILLLVFLATISPAFLSDQQYPKIDRLIATFPFVLIFAAIGADKFIARPFRLSLLVVLLVIFPFYLHYHVTTYFVERVKHPWWKSEEVFTVGDYYLKHTGNGHVYLPADKTKWLFWPYPNYINNYLHALREKGQVTNRDIADWPFHEMMPREPLVFMPLNSEIKDYVETLYPSATSEEVRGFDGILWGYNLKIPWGEYNAGLGLKVDYWRGEERRSRPDGTAVENPVHPGPFTPDGPCTLDYSGYCYLDGDTYSFFQQQQGAQQQCDLRIDQVPVIQNGMGGEPVSILPGWHECEISCRRPNKNDGVHILCQGKNSPPREFTFTQFTHLPLGLHGFFLRPQAPGKEAKTSLMYYGGMDIPGKFIAEGELEVEQPGEYEFTFRDFLAYEQFYLDGKLAGQMVQGKPLIEKLTLKVGRHHYKLTLVEGVVLMWHRTNEPWEPVPYKNLFPGGFHEAFARQLAALSAQPASRPKPAAAKK